VADIPIADLPAHLDSLWHALDSAPLTEPLAKCAAELRSAFAANFAAASAPNFGAWPPRKKAYPWPPLRKSGALFAAATQQGASGHVEEIGGREATVGVEKSSTLPYTHSQNFGWPKTNLPPRPYIDASGQTLDKCQGIIADAVSELLP
jgi:phage gpG-like protein